MKKCFVIMTVVVLFAVWTLVQAQSLDEILKNYAKANGGADKIRAVKTLKMEGKFMSQGMELPITIWAKYPDIIRVEVLISGQKIISAYDGKTGWTINPLTGSGDPRELSKEEVEEVTGSVDMINDPLVDHEKKGHKIELLGKEDMEGTEVFKLKLTRKNKKVSTLYLEAESCILLKIVDTKKVGGQDFEGAMVFGDYKPVAGVMMPHSMETYYKGQPFGAMTVASYEPNIKMENDLFKMPEVEKKEEEEKKQEKKK